MDAALQPSPAAVATAAPAWRRFAVRDVLLVALAWTVVATLAALQNGLSRVYDGRPVHWGPLLLSFLADWYTCAVFTPVIVWMVRRWPPERVGWVGACTRYVGPLCAMVVAKFIALIPIHRAIPGSDDRTLAQLLADGFFYEFLALASVLGMALALHYYRSVRERERRAAELEALLSDARLHALTGQLRPHFLFNALHGVSTLMHRDVEAADEMLSELSALLRATLDREDVQEVPLHEELATARHYVEIMRVRFGDRLGVMEEIDPRARRALVPRLVLQPLVENAVEHGIARDPGAGRIWIRAEAEDGRCTLTVADDGPGLAGGSEAAVREGVGLSNTRRRLAQLYGTDATLSLAARREGGTEVVIRLPFRPSADDTAE